MSVGRKAKTVEIKKKKEKDVERKAERQRDRETGSAGFLLQLELLAVSLLETSDVFLMLTVKVNATFSAVSRRGRSLMRGLTFDPSPLIPTLTAHPCV